MSGLDPRTSRAGRHSAASWIPLLGLAVLLAPGVAWAAPQAIGRVTEVRPHGAAGTQVLIQPEAGAKVRVGQTIEVRRGAKTVGYGSVDQVFKAGVVATVGTVVDGEGPLRPGDGVRFLDGGFTASAAPDDAPSPPAHRAPAAPAAPATPAAGVTPPAAGAPPHGKVVSVRDGVVLIDVGRKSGIEVGHEVALLDPKTGQERGRIAVQLVGTRTSGGLITAGTATVGLEAVVVGKAAQRHASDEGIDFVALDFLGVVANLERTATRGERLGVSVQRVMAGSPAAQAGIRHGDRVLAVDSLVVRDATDIRDRVAARKSSVVQVLLLRGDRVIQLAVDFGRAR